MKCGHDKLATIPYAPMIPYTGAIKPCSHDNGMQKVRYSVDKECLICKTIVTVNQDDEIIK